MYVFCIDAAGLKVKLKVSYGVQLDVQVLFEYKSALGSILIL